MKNLNNYHIDYSLFEKYDKEYFIINLILPIFEDDICIQFCVCKDSNLLHINEKFSKLVKFKECDSNELLFTLSFIDTKIKLFNLSKKAISLNNIDEKHISKFFDELLKYAIENRASDIHIESYKNQVVFRFRVDGKLKTFFSVNLEFFKLISSYIKLTSNLDITLIRLPQDSRFSKTIDDKTYDFRVSCIPTVKSESIVIRVLDKKNINKSLDNLGLSFDVLTKIKNSMNLTQGLVLVTGPTGSGKTTTLYSMLKHLDTNEKKIITVEDPVEYKIDSLCQVAVNTKVGLSFEMILKNILRQDPDIIFIGEIRDEFSLSIALQASLTGHLVIASIHANNSVDTISRLFDLKADPFLISSTLKLVLSQRLALAYCKYCNLKGCEKCNYTKYYERLCIAEALEIDEKLSSMIFRRTDLNEIKSYLKTIKFKSMLDDGLQKVQDNLSSKEEIYKVIYS